MDHPLHVNAGRMHLFGVDVSGFDEFFDLGDGDPTGGGGRVIEVLGTAAIDEIAVPVTLPGVYQREVGDDPALQNVLGAIEFASLLRRTGQENTTATVVSQGQATVGDGCPDSGGGEECRDTCSAGAQSLGQSALGCQFHLEFSGQILPGELLVGSDVGADGAAYPMLRQQQSEPDSIGAAVVADGFEIGCALFEHGSDEDLGNPDQPETSYGDGGAIGDVGDGSDCGTDCFVEHVDRVPGCTLIVQLYGQRTNERLNMALELANTDTGPESARQTIVFLGSLGSTRAMWDPQVTELSAAGFRVVTLDLRGHGESAVPPGSYSVAELAGDVLHTLDGLGLASVHLVGLSLGGAVAQHIALTAPDRIATLTLMCTSARFGEPAAWADRGATVRSSGTTAIADAVVDRWFTLGLADSDPQLVEIALAMVTDTDDQGYAACCDALAEWDSRADLPKISAPTLVIAGAQDPSTPPSELQFIAENIPGAHLEVLDPGAHLVNLEQAAQVSALISAHAATS